MPNVLTLTISHYNPFDINSFLKFPSFPIIPSKLSFVTLGYLVTFVAHIMKIGVVNRNLTYMYCLYEPRFGLFYPPDVSYKTNEKWGNLTVGTL